jgi:hypothetical protein
MAASNFKGSHYRKSGLICFSSYWNVLAFATCAVYLLCRFPYIWVVYHQIGKPLLPGAVALDVLKIANAPLRRRVFHSCPGRVGKCHPRFKQGRYRNSGDY